MLKRSIKIVILFLLIIIVLTGGWNLYRKLEYNKQSVSANIHDYISPLAKEVIYINKGYGINEIYPLYPYTKELIEVLNEEYSPPVVIFKYKNNESVLLTKASIEQESKIKGFIENNISTYFPAKKRKYKDAEVLFYSLPDNNFLVCSFHKGIFAVSRNYKPIKTFIDSDPENTFFPDENNKELIDKMLLSSSINIFTKTETEILAVNYTFHNDSITLDGYVFSADKINSDTVSPGFPVIPYMIDIPDNLCIDSCSISENNKPTSIKIFINKKF
ncbi:MAG: hypothetical protein LBL79_08365 [Prevotella sp.]|jgi:hypothetical protein|nr:hypothetical protein [Prevotella sp.]